jgi:hypothetical protein
MGTCRARVDNGRQCRRKAKTLRGLCGKCHGLTEKKKQCKKKAKGFGKYCKTYHTESMEFKGARSKSREPQSRNRRSTNDGKRPEQQRQLSRAPKEPSVRLRVEAAKLCADAIISQALGTSFEQQITDLVSDKVVERLMKDWDGRHCTELAKIARRLLGIRTYLRRIIAYLINRLMLVFGYKSTVRAFVCELVSILPVPWHSKVTAAARIIQLTGICLCFMNERNLKDCECLIDLLRFESKEVISRLLTASLHDWREIANTVPAED